MSQKHRAHASLHRIIGTILDTPSFWPHTELAQQLRRDMVKLLERIDSLEPWVANDYCYALANIASRMPDGIDKIYRGHLAALLGKTASFESQGDLES